MLENWKRILEGEDIEIASTRVISATSSKMWTRNAAAVHEHNVSPCVISPLDGDSYLIWCYR